MTLVNLGDVAETIMGQAPPGKDCNKSGKGTVFVKAGEFDERFPVVREWTTKPLKIARDGDVLVCVVGATAGKVNQAINCAIGRSVAAVRPDRRTLDPTYLYHFLCSQTGRLRAQSQGLAQGVITREMLQVLEISLPPLDEQRRIAAILDQVDALRRLRQRSIGQLEILEQSFFYEFFGDPATNPKRWPHGTIRDLVCDVRYGTAKKAHTEKRGLPILRMGNITFGGKLDLSDMKYIELEKREIPKYIVKPDDIMFNRTNSKDLVGKTAVFNLSDKMVIAGYLIRARVKANADPYFISGYLNSPHGKATLRNLCKNIVGMANINAQEFQDIEIILPDRDTQREFRFVVEDIEKQRQVLERSLKHFELLCASAQQRAFNGRL